MFDDGRPPPVSDAATGADVRVTDPHERAEDHLSAIEAVIDATLGS